MDLNRILAIPNLAAERQLAMERAQRLASLSGAQLRVHAVAYEPEFSDGIFHWHDEHRAAGRKRRLEEIRGSLEEALVASGLGAADIAVVWDHPFDHAVMAAAREFDADLVIVQPRELGRPQLSTAEWRLLSRCPAPLLLARSLDWPARPDVLAAVDPSHAHDKPGSLDAEILAAARKLGSIFGGGLKVLHAIGRAPSGIAVAQSPEEYETELRAIRTRSVQGLLPEDVRVQSAISVVAAEPVDALANACAADEVSLMVLGILARSRIAEFLIGNTAREFIPRSRCDVLLVKPPEASSGSDPMGRC